MTNYLFSKTCACRQSAIFQHLCTQLSINQSLFSIQTNNDDNIHTFINMNTERAGNEVILLI